MRRAQRIQPDRSARCKVRGVRSEVKRRMWRDRAWRGRAGQAFDLGKPGVFAGATANSLDANRRGPQQVDQIVKTKPLRRSCLRILDQSLEPREPALQGTGRLNGPAPCQARSRVGWTISTNHADYCSRQIDHPIRALSRRASSCTGRVGVFVFHPIACSLYDDRLPVMHQPVDQGGC